MLKIRKHFFERMASKWDDINYHDEDKINHILDNVKLNAGSKILDIGTGTGVLLPYILNKCNNDCHITAVDYSENMIIRAKEKYPHNNINFLVQDVYSMQDKFRDYDTCICYSVFPHFSNKPKVIQILTNSIKQGGQLIIAHSQSRRAINDVHRKKSIAVKYDNLPDATTITDYFVQWGLKPLKIVDTEDMFYIVGEKI